MASGDTLARAAVAGLAFISALSRKRRGAMNDADPDEDEDEALVPPLAGEPNFPPPPPPLPPPPPPPPPIPLPLLLLPNSKRRSTQLPSAPPANSTERASS